jgi:hypothetical protein
MFIGSRPQVQLMRCLDSLAKMLSLRRSLRERIYVARTTRGLAGRLGRVHVRRIGEIKHRADIGLSCVTLREMHQAKSILDKVRIAVVSMF